MHKYLTRLALAVAACAVTHTVVASPLLEVEIVARSDGRILPSWRHQGRLWVAGDPGEAYAVRLVNRSPGRVLAVLSVDGVNAVSGETAAAQQSGYVLTAGRSADVRGWRKSLDEIAQFTFTRLSDSYAARTGRPDNVGVIGVALFREAPMPEVFRQDVPSVGRSKSAAPANEASGAAAPGHGRDEIAREAAESERLGTGHGAREHDPTRYTEFRRASAAPAETIVIYYDSYQNLLARGIVPRERRYSAPRPDPFPGRFVPDPLG